MDLEDNTQGNPDNGSESDDFFNALEDNVNSAIQDDPSPEQVTPLKGDSSVTGSKSDPEAEVDNLKKRYSDSSREAQKIKAQLDELKPFVPVLDAMKSDSNLVEHVRDYFTSGGQPSKTVSEPTLKLCAAPSVLMYCKLAPAASSSETKPADALNVVSVRNVIATNTLFVGGFIAAVPSLNTEPNCPKP